MLEEACRIRSLCLKNERPPELKLKTGPNKTRSSFAHAARSKIVSKLVPVNFSSDQINYLPIGNSPLYDLQPIFTIKNILEYLVIKRQGRRECLAGRGFTKCCREGANCQNTRCAKCWALAQRVEKGVEYVVREVIDGTTPKVVDPFGVDPKGRRPKGKALDLVTRARFRLTSTQDSYKHKNSAWE